MKKQNVLIVDDESANISVLFEILNEKYNILVATDGVTALEIVNSTENIDLILLDIVMPEMDGYEVAYTLKHNKKTVDLPFIFLTAKNDSQSIVKGFSAGAVDYISKPFEKEELLIRVHTHLQLYKLKNALSNAFSEVQSKVNELDMLNSELFKNKNFLQSVLDYTSHAIITTDINGTITLFNKAAQRMLGYSSSELVDKQSPAIFHDISEVEQRAKEFSKELGEKIEVGFDVFIAKSRHGLNNTHEWKYITKSKDIIIVSLSISALQDNSGNITGYIGIAEDISQKKRNEKKIKDYVELVDKNIITSSTDLKGNITYASEAFCKISGYTKEELLSKNHRVIRHPDTSKDLFVDLWEKISADKEWRGSLKNRAKDGSFYWVDTAIYPIYNEDNKKVGYTAIRQDITDKKRVEELSIRDELTSLYNRRYFNEVLEKELQRVKRDSKNIVFLMIDIDHFKQYNDTYGHQAGDDVLEKIGAVLNDFSKRAGDFAFRLGGEEFGLIYYEETTQDILEFANNLIKAIEALKIPHINNSASEFITGSVGLVCKNVDQNTTPEEIYKEADENLYKAKESGRNKVVSNI